jgi:hypothetical protein
MPIVTSPGFKVLPWDSDWTLGSADAIQRSCAGFVYTPMFGLVTLTSVVDMVDMATGEETDADKAKKKWERGRVEKDVSLF